MIIVSNKDRMSPSRTSEVKPEKPFNPDAYTIGKSNCSSVAPNLSNNSKVEFSTYSIRAPGRSTLFTTTIGRNPSAKAFLVTNRVCGIGPSTASTRSKTPSTIDNTRSTSPPKSACPGVSTILMCVPSYSTAQFFAKIVMPRSFSKSFESMTLSVIA